MLRKDFEEEKKKRKRKAGIVLLMMAIVLLAGFVLGFCQWKSHENKTEEAEAIAEETATETEEEAAGETETETGTEAAEERPAVLWEDNGPDDRDVPEEADAAYSQEITDTEVTAETQGGMQ